MKVMHFSHVDLDGWGSIVILRRFYEQVFGITPAYRIVNYGFEENPSTIEDILSSDVIFFTDVSFSPEFAMKLNTLVTEYSKKIVLLDHHKTAVETLSSLNYEWMHLDISRCGTLLTYDYCNDLCCKIGKRNVLKGYRYFAEIVNGYDLWLHLDYNSTRMQFLWANCDHEYFVNRFVNNPFTGTFTDEEEDAMLASELIFENSKKSAEDNLVIERDIDGLTFGVTIKPQFYSLVSHYVMKNHPELDYVVLNDGKSLSFRSNDLNILWICEMLGGGGHDKSCGASMPSILIDPVKTVQLRTWVYHDFVGKFSGVSEPH